MIENVSAMIGIVGGGLGLLSALGSFFVMRYQVKELREENENHTRTIGALLEFRAKSEECDKHLMMTLNDVKSILNKVIERELDR